MKIKDVISEGRMVEKVQWHVLKGADGTDKHIGKIYVDTVIGVIEEKKKGDKVTYRAMMPAKYFNTYAARALDKVISLKAIEDDQSKLEDMLDELEQSKISKTFDNLQAAKKEIEKMVSQMDTRMFVPDPELKLGEKNFKGEATLKIPTVTIEDTTVSIKKVAFYDDSHPPKEIAKEDASSRNVSRIAFSMSTGEIMELLINKDGDLYWTQFGKYYKFPDKITNKYKDFIKRNFGVEAMKLYTEGKAAQIAKLQDSEFRGLIK